MYVQKVKKKFIIILGIVIGVSFILEMFVFNNHLYFESKGQKEQVLSLEDAVVTGCSYDEEEGIIVNGEASTIQIDSDVKAISLTITTKLLSKSEEELSTLEGKISVEDDANSCSPLQIQNFIISPGTKRTVRCESGGKLHTLILDLDEYDKDYVITGITVNSHSIPLQFSFFRFFGLIILVYGLYLIREFGWIERVYQPNNWKHNVCVLLGCMLCILFVIYVAKNTNVNHSNNLYLKLYESFSNGENYIEEADSSLAQLGDQVMDNSVRTANNASFTLDTVYYNGYIYCYFGLAPLPYYYLHHAIFHKLPNDTQVMCFYEILFVLFCWLAMREIVKVFHFRVNFLLYLLVNFAVVFGSLTLCMESNASFYTMPALCAAVGTIASVFFSYRAYALKSSFRRRIHFALAGFAFAYILASRPNVCLMALALNAPLYCSVLIEKGVKAKEKVIDAGSFFIVALGMSSIVFYYNYSRFGSILDFGVWNQLTVYNIRYYKFQLSVHNICYGIYHYFLQLPNFKIQFPFLQFTGNGVEGKYIYFNKDYTGIFIMPINWIWLALPFLYRKKYQKKFALNESSTLAKSVVGVTAMAAIVLAVFNYCMGGINLRYVLDISIGTLLVSVMLVFAMHPKLRPGSICYKMACILCVATIFVGVLFVFQNSDCNWKNVSAKSFVKAYDFFMGIME